MDDWKIGDLALCVDDGPVKIIGGLAEAKREHVEALRKGVIYTITHISKGRTCPCIGLGDASERAGGVSTRFRKIRPLTDEERQSFMDDLRILELTEPAGSHPRLSSHATTIESSPGRVVLPGPHPHHSECGPGLSDLLFQSVHG